MADAMVFVAHPVSMNHFKVCTGLIRPMERREMTTETEKTISVPEAGRRYFGLGRGTSYEAAHRGDIPTIRIGRRIRVPIRALERMLDATIKEPEPSHV
jgi:excisionase family DNA binding protein